MDVGSAIFHTRNHVGCQLQYLAVMVGNVDVW